MCRQIVSQPIACVASTMRPNCSNWSYEKHAKGARCVKKNNAETKNGNPSTQFACACPKSNNYSTHKRSPRSNRHEEKLDLILENFMKSNKNHRSSNCWSENTISNVQNSEVSAQVMLSGARLRAWYLLRESAGRVLQLCLRTSHFQDRETIALWEQSKSGSMTS